MGTALTGLVVGSTYVGLLKTTDNAVINSTLRTITDGSGNDTAMQVSSAGVKSTGTFAVDGATTLAALTASSVTVSNLTSGRIPVAGVGGLLGDDADLTFSGDTLTATKFSGALNGTVGATTPTTGAFTTVSSTQEAHIGSTGTRDYVKIGGAAAGNGGYASSLTYDQGDYAAFTLVGHPLVIAARTTAGNSTTVAQFSSTGPRFSVIPTSASGLSSGDVWSDGGTLKIVS